MAAAPLRFTARRSEPVLVAPARPTPKELKLLSDIDGQQVLRMLLPSLYFYRSTPSMRGLDPARAIRESVSKALVFYYPFAGRLREGPGGKLAVECTGEGILFVEADAHVRLDQFGDPPRPPFPCVEELIPDVKGSDGVLHCPLLLIQVTRLTCGGFIVGLRINHTMCDATGLFHLLRTIGEIARGANAPSVLPVWSRELLTARTPPKVTHQHPMYDELLDISTSPAEPPAAATVLRFFFFGPSEMSMLRRRMPPSLRTATTFELLTACIWRCRTSALQLHPRQEVRVLFVANFRKVVQPRLPAGYYGNAFAFLVAVSTAEKLCSNPLYYAVDLLRRAKAEVTAEYIQSMVDLIGLSGRPPTKSNLSYNVSDFTQANLSQVDFGWGMPLFSGLAIGDTNPVEVASVYTRSRNNKGEEGFSVPLSLPALAMERFAMEIENMTQKTTTEDPNDNGPILSSL